MRMKKAMIMTATLLIVFFLLYRFLPSMNQTKQVSVDAPTSIMKKQVENHSEATVAEDEEPTVEDSVSATSVKEEIKEKVREIVDGAVDLFQKDKKIVAIGDSLTQGIGDETKGGGYVGILNNTFEDNHINITIENYGKRGNRTDQLLKRLETKKMATSIKDADIVLITIGANDVMNVVKNNFTHLKMKPFQEEQVAYVERLNAIFTKINELNPEVQIYLIGFYNPFEQYFSEIEQLGMILNMWNQASKTVTEQYDNVYFIPTQDLFNQTNLDLLSEDQFHPNMSGYKLIAKRVLEYIKEYSEESEISS